MAENKVEVVIQGTNNASAAFLTATADFRAMVGQFTSGQAIIAGAAGLIGGAVATLGLKVVDAVKHLATMPLEVGRAGNALVEMSQRTGIAAQDLSRWSNIAEASGTSIQAIANSMRTLSRVMAETGDTRDLNTAFMDTIRYLQGINNESLRLAEAQRLLGRSAMELGTLYGMTADELRKLSEASDQAGATMSAGLLKASAELDDAQDRLKMTMQGVHNEIAEKGILIWTALINTINDAVTATRGFGAAVSGSGGPGFFMRGGSAGISHGAWPGPFTPTRLPEVVVTPGAAGGAAAVAASMPWRSNQYGAAIGPEMQGYGGGFGFHPAYGGFPEFGPFGMRGAAGMSVDSAQYAQPIGPGLNDGIRELSSATLSLSGAFKELTGGALSGFKMALAESTISLLATIGAGDKKGLPGQIANFGSSAVRALFHFANEGYVPMMAGASYGRDSIPAMLTPGEAVVRPGSSFAREVAGGATTVNVHVSGSNTYMDRLRLALDAREAFRSTAYTGVQVPV